jgi:hypothetical protein
MKIILLDVLIKLFFVTGFIFLMLRYLVPKPIEFAFAVVLGYFLKTIELRND